MRQIHINPRLARRGGKHAQVTLKNLKKKSFGKMVLETVMSTGVMV